MPEAAGCVECAFLRERHAQATLEHVRVRAEIRQVLWGKKRQAMTALTAAEAMALRQLEEAEAAIRHHDSLAHGRGFRSVHVGSLGYP